QAGAWPVNVATRLVLTGAPTAKSMQMGLRGCRWGATGDRRHLAEPDRLRTSAAACRAIRPTAFEADVLTVGEVGSIQASPKDTGQRYHSNNPEPQPGRPCSIKARDPRSKSNRRG